jgi:hypothetical protein
MFRVVAGAASSIPRIPMKEASLPVHRSLSLRTGSSGDGRGDLLLLSDSAGASRAPAARRPAVVPRLTGCEAQGELWHRGTTSAWRPRGPGPCPVPPLSRVVAAASSPNPRSRSGNRTTGRIDGRMLRRAWWTAGPAHPTVSGCPRRTPPEGWGRCERPPEGWNGSTAPVEVSCRRDGPGARTATRRALGTGPARPCAGHPSSRRRSGGLSSPTS